MTDLTHAAPRAASPAIGPYASLRLDLRSSPPGRVELAPVREHRVKIQVNGPVRGACQHQRFVYQRGDVDIFPTGMDDAWDEQDPSRSLIISLPQALLRRVAEDLGQDPERVGLQPRHQFRDPRIEHIAWALEAERASDSPSGLLYAESLGIALASHLLGQYPAIQRSGPRLNARQLQALIHYIDDHLDQPLTLDELGKVVSISASHLRVLFKQSTGLPVHEYVIRRRVERARTLLLQRELPASQVALEAGFSHQSHMARCMRRILGATPRQLVRG
jgi:AraC family transcriptional regulator